MDQLTQERVSQPSTVSSMTQSASGQQSPSSKIPSKTFPKHPLVILVFLFSLLGGGLVGYFSLQPRNSQRQASAPSPASNSSRPVQESVGHYVGTQTISLRDVTSRISSGRVARIYTDTRQTHDVEVTLPDLPENMYYQFWVINNQQDIFPLVLLNKDVSGKYTALHEWELGPSDSFTFTDLYNTVVVSLETVNDDVMETKILEGTFIQ